MLRRHTSAMHRSIGALGLGSPWLHTEPHLRCNTDPSTPSTTEHRIDNVIIYQNSGPASQELL
eukprot:7300392-Pyramimonas_sp.AAC.1